MPKIKSKEEMKSYRRYHSPGASNLNSVKLNAIFINKNIKKGYTKEHESMKFDLAWEARGFGENFLTESERSATDEEIEIFGLKSKKIVDFVNLTRGQEYEIVHKHESDKQIKFYRDNGTGVIITGNTIICEKCNKEYPSRNKKFICGNCKT